MTVLMASIDWEPITGPQGIDELQLEGVRTVPDPIEGRVLSIEFPLPPVVFRLNSGVLTRCDNNNICSAETRQTPKARLKW